MAIRSLWLHPREKPLDVEIDRFRDYAYFFDSFERYGVTLPSIVSVSWKPLVRYLEPFEEEQDFEFVRQVEPLIEVGEDVPPILVMKSRLAKSSRARIFDGRHRAWAAWHLGLRKAPVVDITPYWPAGTVL